jgi:hypothetical protein
LHLSLKMQFPISGVLFVISLQQRHKKTPGDSSILVVVWPRPPPTGWFYKHTFLYLPVRRQIERKPIGSMGLGRRRQSQDRYPV